MYLTNKLNSGLWNVDRGPQVSVCKVQRQVESLPMHFVHFAHFDKPVQQDGPHFGLQIRVPAKKTLGRFPDVHSALLVTDQVPDLLLVGPADIWKWCYTTGMFTEFYRIGLNELPKAEIGKNQFYMTASKLFSCR